MNLVEIHARGMNGFAFSPKVKSLSRPCFGEDWLGLELAPGDVPQIVIQKIIEHRPLRSFPARPGWFLRVAGSGTAQLAVRFRDRTSRAVLSERNYRAQDNEVFPVELPWPPLAQSLMQADLELQVPKESVPLFLAVSRSLERKNLSTLCKGKGIEIGPGVTPQVLPGPGVDILYAEEKSREDWLKTYAYKLDKYEGDLNALPWDRYHLRTAFDLPAEDGVLDFIFASHVLEHLVNPLGHLEHWLKKLKPGGLVAGILPNADASVDYQMFPSMLPTIALEYDRRETSPNLNHYRLMFGNDAEKRMQEGRTLHVHFYNPRNFQDFISYAGGSLPIGGFRIQAEPNYKEFFFTVVKK
ncbi:MAG: methyltransferase domain-containing protein [Proteobacteria bacterium]|nr:methyltransferase domain-containing protein [Pseudomonadota bacterium]